jgi:hypothetical protein
LLELKCLHLKLKELNQLSDTTLDIDTLDKMHGCKNSASTLHPTVYRLFLVKMQNLCGGKTFAIQLQLFVSIAFFFAL